MERHKTWRMRPTILRREHYRCRICLRVYPEHELTVDHIKPLCLGGVTARYNLRLLCHTCHEAANRRLSAWLLAKERGEAVLPYGWRLADWQVRQLRNQ